MIRPGDSKLCYHEIVGDPLLQNFQKETQYELKVQKVNNTMVKLKLLSVVLLMITGNITTLKILTGSDRAYSFDQHQKVIKILKQCFRNELTTIIAAFESSQYVMDFRKELPDTSIILVNNDGSEYNQKWLFSDAPIYVLETGSEEDLGSTLTTLQLLPWWGRSAPFFLIGSSNNSCIDAKKILSTMWTEKISSTIYVCHDHEDNNYKIFTFNPFTNKAPEPWKLSRYNSAGRWTLSEQPIQENNEICPNLMFDKTKYLDGYEVKATYSNNFDNKSRNSSLAGWMLIQNVPFNTLILDLFNQLNVSVSVKGFKKPNNFTATLYEESFSKLVTNEYDICLSERPIFREFPLKLQPLLPLRSVIITERKPLLRPEEKISRYYFQNGTFLLIFIAIILISATLLRTNHHQTFSVALLKIWESVFNLVIRDHLNRFWVRIYFFGVFLFFMIIAESFKGNLTAFLLKPERLKVDTVQDLINFGQRMYVHQVYQHLPSNFLYGIPKEKLLYYNQYHCEQYIDNHTACLTLDTRFKFFNSSTNKKFHLSKPMMMDYSAWFMSHKFPLNQRLQTALLHYSQSGLIDYWYERDWLRKREKIESLEAEEIKAPVRPIELDDLLFAFKFLIIGLSCSFVVFILEISRR